jgi:hypothetical protein
LVVACLLKNHVGKLFFSGSELFPGGDAFGIEQALLDQLGTAGLHREVGLRERYFLLFGVAVLGDEVAGLAGEHEVVHLTLAARS